MCLETIDKSVRPRKGKDGLYYGWKVYEEERGKLYGDCQCVGVIRPVCKWIRARLKRIYPRWDGGTYMSGFHIFVTRADAREWAEDGDKIRRVAFREYHVAGIQEDKRVVVAKEIMILPEKGDKA